MSKRLYTVSGEHMNASGWISDAVVNEKQMEAKWFQYKAGDVIHDTNGEAILIVDLGVANQNEGPDIQGAILFSNGRLLKGDIEIHRRSRDWFYHGHETDPNYNHIILHLIHQLDRDDQQLNGQIHFMPIVQGTKACSIDRQNLSESFETTLVKMGLNRFQEKVNRYRHRGWQDYALEDLCHLLGKGGNESGFRQLLSHFQNEGESIPSIHWHKRGIRPHAWPDKRIDLALALFSYFKKWEDRPISIPEKISCIVSGHLFVELKGNIFLPLMGSRALINNNFVTYQSIKLEWTSLKLPTPYGRFVKKYSPILPHKTIKKFAVSQGLLWLENHWCHSNHCDVCPLKDLHGTTVQN